MPNAPLCALVHDSSRCEPHALAASARACLADIRTVLARHGFVRAAAGLALAALAVEDDLEAIALDRLMAGEAAE
ncbi:MAG: hypothetical protein AB1918_02465 [Pseudomonadota bacterium]